MVKIAIKFALLFVVLVAMFLGFNLFMKKPLIEEIQVINKKTDQNNFLNENLNNLVAYKPMWDPILAAQKRDLEYIRAVIPAAPFHQDHYLRGLLDVFHRSQVYSTGLTIRNVRRPPKHLSYIQFFNLDIAAFVVNVQNFQNAFKYLQEADSDEEGAKPRHEFLTRPQGEISTEELELALWYSFRFNQMMSVNIPEGLNVVPGLEVHRFDTSVKGSYEDIKRFLWNLKNMTPHTVLANWHLSMGRGVGESRVYSATLSLITFVDTNQQPTYGKEILPDYKSLPNEIALMLEQVKGLGL